jgi:molybdate transport system ATP-binding protein
MLMEPMLIELNDCSVSYARYRALRSVSWRLRPGECWTVMGPNGSGKSTFLRLLMGELHPFSGTRLYWFTGVPEDAPFDAPRHVAMVSPNMLDEYVRNDLDFTGEYVVASGFTGGVYLPVLPIDAERARVREIMHRLGVERLLDKSILEMSRGEGVKTLLARALISNPHVLLLDEIDNGLIEAARTRVHRLLGHAFTNGVSIVHTAHRREAVLPFATHGMVLDRGRVTARGPYAKKELDETIRRTFHQKHGMSGAPSIGTARRPVGISIRDVSVYYDSHMALRNINWRIGPGECWAILGPNGSGKSTLLKLLVGDVRPALGGSIRYGGETLDIWTIKEHIGYVSPWLQARYEPRATGLETLVSGLFSSIGVYDRVTREQKQRAADIMDALGIQHLQRKELAKMSYGEERKVLLARALVCRPHTLVLDEPLDGLDILSRQEFLALLEAIHRSGTRIIIATHHMEDLPRSVTHALHLKNGGIVFIGKLSV